MEIEFKNIIYKKEKLNFKINEETITGITGAAEDFFHLISLRDYHKGQIFINKKKVTLKNKDKYLEKISVVPKELSYTYELSVNQIIEEYIISNKLIIKNVVKKINDALKIVGIPDELLIKSPNILSKSEKKLLQIAISLLSNPECIVLDEPFKCLDKNNTRNIIVLLRRLKEQFKKSIVILSDDCEILYKYTDNMIFIKNNQIIAKDLTQKLYENIEFLKNNNFSIPQSVIFTNIAKTKKQIKIEYHRDVRDIIKDIYKHI